MIRSHTLRKRDLYLDKLIAFQDTEPIKVVTVRKVQSAQVDGGASARKCSFG